MTAFWISAAALCLLTLFILWRPLNARSALKMESIQQRNIAIAKERALEIESSYDAGDISQQDRDQALEDLQRALADELATSTELKDQFRQSPKASTLLVLALTPFVAYAVYDATSNFNPDAKPGIAVQNNSEAAPSFEDIITQLEEAIAANPEDQQGLYLLAQSYAQLGRYGESADLFKQLLALTGPNADLLVSFADAQAMASGRVFNAEMARSLDQALSLDPKHISGLWLGGLAEQQLGRPEKALRRWLVLRPLLSENPEATTELAGLIDQVSVELGPRAAEISQEFAQIGAETSTAGTASGLTVRVSLSPELQSEANDSDIVFIFAKAKQGPPMPLAASRQTVGALPITIHLDDSMAMLPQMKLSSFAEVLVGARISKSGQPVSQPGDLESELTTSASASDTTIEIVISKRRP